MISDIIATWLSISVQFEHLGLISLRYFQFCPCSGPTDIGHMPMGAFAIALGRRLWPVSCSFAPLVQRSFSRTYAADAPGNSRQTPVPVAPKARDGVISCL